MKWQKCFLGEDAWERHVERHGGKVWSEVDG